VLFGLVIFIVAVAVYSSANLQRASYPTDSLGKVCMLDTNTGVNNYPFVYFNDLTNPTADRYLCRYAVTVSRTVPKPGWLRSVTTPVL
jgi:hypothetical protein